MLYFDTSFLAPLILPEATSDKIAKFFRILPSQDWAVSHWTLTEFASLLAREVRMGAIATETAALAAAQFEGLAESFTVLLPNAEDFARARAYLGHYDAGLRAGDALHLAIAANRHAETIYSLDKTFLKAGKILKLPVHRGIT